MYFSTVTLRIVSFAGEGVGLVGTRWRVRLRAVQPRAGRPDERRVSGN